MAEFIFFKSNKIYLSLTQKWEAEKNLKTLSWYMKAIGQRKRSTVVVDHLSYSLSLIASHLED